MEISSPSNVQKHTRPKPRQNVVIMETLNKNAHIFNIKLPILIRIYGKAVCVCVYISARFNVVTHVWVCLYVICSAPTNYYWIKEANSLRMMRCMGAIYTHSVHSRIEMHPNGRMDQNQSEARSIRKAGIPNIDGTCIHIDMKPIQY